ncbi:sulfite reductase flavoprotein subunit alpha [Caulobacter sp. UNC279MFTsu5.1]|uniref:flavodoxin domain-containing protein n=1 Tax=Caulobacter sp. UNC279MFTsu5.1 TaxID=1502775 RepID=UPI00037E260C|nr:sulfite reductase flavoprotein subunit alpha [Caulobacter sp. UNC279MFTsu5.1]SFI80072.1 sulfite reductase (NADPH) flavoprotein alpha-component [Caulobacter sp. UNC279MFTsu5.1]
MTGGWEALTPEARRLWAAGVVVCAYVLFCLAIAWRETLRRRAARRAAQALAAGTGASVLVVHASQTGFAEELALATARLLGDAGARVTLKSLAEVTRPDLAAAGRALFVVSTTGEGDAPDTARRFIRDVMSGEPALHGLSYGVLALGDSSYAQFCAFGRTLDAWLARHGAAPLFDRVEVDDGDPAALRHWQSHVGVLAGVTDAPDWTRPRYGRWRLAERRRLNPGSPGDAAFHIRLEPLAAVAWEAGDILEVGPRNNPAEVAALLARRGLDPSAPVVAEEAPTLAQALSWRRLPHDDGPTADTAQALVHALPPLPHREYSIASLPADGGVELLVRAMRRPDGRPGLGSGWLTAHAAEGSEIAARVRTNRAFHGPPDDRPLILIGNGTGLAGLRAHLKARAAAGRHRNWLVFGERTAAHDYFHREEIEAWRAEGVLQRVDLAFSRDQDRKVYVQHRLAQAADALRTWVADGAAIYVCGSLEGMSGEVHATLTAVLGAETMERLADEGLYRRDVY